MDKGKSLFAICIINLRDLVASAGFADFRREGTSLWRINHDGEVKPPCSGAVYL